MKIAKIEIRDVYGIQELEFEAGAFNVITGQNGSGKTSVLRALRSVLRGGEEALLVRQGQEHGEAVVVLDNGSVIRKRVTAKGETPSYTVDGIQQKRPIEAIKALSDALSVNPVAFLSARPKDRVGVLLEAIPMQVDEGRIRAVMADPEFPIPDGTALAKIQAAHDALYVERRETNRAIKEKASSINQLEATLPCDSGGVMMDQADGEDSLELRLKNLDEVKDAEFKRIENKLENLRQEHDGGLNALREKISEIQLEISRRIEQFAETSRLASVQRDRVRDRWQAERVPVQESLRAIRQDRDAMSRAAATRKTIKVFRDDLVALEADVSRMDEGLKALEGYKSELLASLPIDGLEVVDGDILRNGIAFDHLNKAQQVEIAVEIAKLRAGELGVLCVDDLEMLDTEHFKAFEAQAIASGLQLFVTRVSDDGFAARAAG